MIKHTEITIKKIIKNFSGGVPSVPYPHPRFCRCFIEFYIINDTVKN